MSERSERYSPTQGKSRLIRNFAGSYIGEFGWCTDTNDACIFITIDNHLYSTTLNKYLNFDEVLYYDQLPITKWWTNEHNVLYTIYQGLTVMPDTTIYMNLEALSIGTTLVPLTCFPSILKCYGYIKLPRPPCVYWEEIADKLQDLPFGCIDNVCEECPVVDTLLPMKVSDIFKLNVRYYKSTKGIRITWYPLNTAATFMIGDEYIIVDTDECITIHENTEYRICDIREPTLLLLFRKK